MRRLSTFIAGAIIAAGIAVTTTVAYGDFASEKDLCASQWKHFQVVRAQSGLIGLTDEQFTKYHNAGQGIVDAEAARQSKFSVDQNYTYISGEVTFHANEIVKAAEVKDQEEIQVQYRWLTISCKNCHRMYRTDQRLSP